MATATGWDIPFRCLSLHYFVDGKSLCWNKQRGYLTVKFVRKNPGFWSSRKCVKCQAKLNQMVRKNNEKSN
jgi:hypothetical protein